MADYIERQAAIAALRKFGEICKGSTEAATAAAMAISVISRLPSPWADCFSLDAAAGCAGGGKMSYNEALRIVTAYSVALSMGYALDKDCCLEYVDALRIVLQRAEQEVTECEC